jgi:hypothetical protein
MMFKEVVVCSEVLIKVLLILSVLVKELCEVEPDDKKLEESSADEIEDDSVTIEGEAFGDVFDTKELI